jgi:hypothetical protein
MAEKTTTTTGAKERKKTKCPITKEVFVKAAKPLKITVDGKDYTMEVKEFSSGSFGFYCNEKVTIDIDGEPVKFQAGFNLTAVGSKPEKK